MQTMLNSNLKNNLLNKKYKKNREIKRKQKEQLKRRNKNGIRLKLIHLYIFQDYLSI